MHVSFYYNFLKVFSNIYYHSPPIYAPDRDPRVGLGPSVGLPPFLLPSLTEVSRRAFFFAEEEEVLAVEEEEEDVLVDFFRLRARLFFMRLLDLAVLLVPGDVDSEASVAVRLRAEPPGALSTSIALLLLLLLDEELEEEEDEEEDWPGVSKSFSNTS